MSAAKEYEAGISEEFLETEAHHLTISKARCVRYIICDTKLASNEAGIVETETTSETALSEETDVSVSQCVP